MIKEVPNPELREIPEGVRYYLGVAIPDAVLKGSAPHLLGFRMANYQDAQTGRTPFHFTVYQPFETLDIGRVVELVRGIVVRIEPFELELREIGDFGEATGVVWLGPGPDLDRCSPLYDLHVAIVKTLEFCAQSDQLKKLYSRFEGRDVWSPHATVVADVSGKVSGLRGEAERAFSEDGGRLVVPVRDLTLFSRQEDGNWLTYEIPLGRELAP